MSWKLVRKASGINDQLHIGDIGKILAAAGYPIGKNVTSFQTDVSGITVERHVGAEERPDLPRHITTNGKESRFALDIDAGGRLTTIEATKRFWFPIPYGTVIE